MNPNGQVTTQPFRDRRGKLAYQIVTYTVRGEQNLAIQCFHCDFSATPQDETADALQALVIEANFHMQQCPKTGRTAHLDGQLRLRDMTVLRSCKPIAGVTLSPKNCAQTK